MTRTVVFKCDLCGKTDERLSPAWFRVSSMREIPCPDGLHPRDHETHPVFHVCDECATNANLNSLGGV